MKKYLRNIRENNALAFICVIAMIFIFLSNAKLYAQNIENISIPKQMMGEYKGVQQGHIINLILNDDSIICLPLSINAKYTQVSDSVFIINLKSKDVFCYYLNDSIIIDTTVFCRTIGLNAKKEVFVQNHTKFNRDKQRIEFHGLCWYMESNYRVVIRYKNGVKNGKYMMLNQDNKFEYVKGHFKNGLKNGKWIISNRNKKASVYYHNGVIVKAEGGGSKKR